VQRIHLPVTTQSGCAEVTVLVDKVLPRAREVAAEFRIPQVAGDYREILREAGTNVDAALVAIPNFLHAPVSIELLQAGIHVLVEKPMALTAQDCDRMIDAAEKAGVALTVGLNSRFSWEVRFVKQALETGLLGEIQSFDLQRGSVFTWPVTSSYTFARTRSGGGVLMDIGPHVLDLLLWWLGDYQHVAYWDDSQGGVEANCKLDLTLKSGVPGTVELSRDRELRDSWILRGDRATLELASGASSPTPLRLWMGEREQVLAGHATSKEGQDATHRDLYRRQLEDFCDAIHNHREPFVGKEGKKSIELIEACYALRQPIEYPWRVRDLACRDTAREHGVETSP
jgi:predicted dehydrogenase